MQGETDAKVLTTSSRMPSYYTNGNYPARPEIQ